MGHRKGRRRTDIMFALRIIVEKILEFNKKVHVLFINLKKDFDSVP